MGRLPIPAVGGRFDWAMRAVIAFIERITEAAGGVAALVIVPLVVATCYEVFARYALGAPTIWAFELGYTLMGIHFLLGGALTLRRQGHVRIDVIYAHLAPRQQATIDLVLYVFLILPCLALLSNRLISYAIEAYVSGETTGNSAWNPAIWPLRTIIAASFVLLALQVIAECLKCLLVLAGRDEKAA